jgi:hypothetical protein
MAPRESQPMLVVVEHRDVQGLLEPVLHLEADRGGDVLEVDATERRCDRGAGVDEDLGVLRVDADRVGVDAAELLEQHRFALHHRHPGGSADVAEAEDRGAVGDDGDHVRADREVERLERILGDRLRHTRHSGHVDDRQVIAVLQRDRGHHLDLAAAVHREGTVVVREDVDALDASRRRDDPLGVLQIGGVDDELARDRAVARADQVDRPDVAAYLADGGGEAPEQVARLGLDLDADGDAVLGARRDSQRCSLRAVECRVDQPGEHTVLLRRFLSRAHRLAPGVGGHAGAVHSQSLPIR